MARNRGSISNDTEASLSAEGAPEVPPSAPTEDAPPLEPPPDAPPPGDKPPEAASPELLTPCEWARRKGLLVEGNEPHATGFHASAEQLHGWAWHAQNYQAPKDAFRLTESDYDAALVAASQFLAKPAHEAALAPHFPKPEVPEQVAKACAARDAAAAAEEKRG